MPSPLQTKSCAHCGNKWSTRSKAARTCSPKCRAQLRNQERDNNSSWKGDSASYAALHLRVQVARGKPARCDRCGTTAAGRYEWANLTGQYTDIYDYQRMCVSCHQQYGAARRRATGMRTSPARR